MASQAPKIDPRTYQDIVARTEGLAQLYTAWRPRPDGRPDAGRALIGIFARMAELLIARLNQVPDKNFLAFLELIGAQALPPQPARVPLTFQLAAGSMSDALVPARTQVAATPVAGDPGPIVFETERDLVVTRSQLAAAFTREPARDRYADHTAVATSQSDAVFSVFEGNQPTVHRLYLGHNRLFGLARAKQIAVQFTPSDPDRPWPSAIAWSYWDGIAMQTLRATPQQIQGGWQVVLPGVPGIPATEVAGRACSWLYLSLLQAGDLPPDAAFAGAALDLKQPWYPFGAVTPPTTFYLACDDVFSKAGSLITIGVNVDDARPAWPSGDLVLTWEYFDGTVFRLLGRSALAFAADTDSPFDFADGTLALTRDGEITFDCPPNWAAGPGPGAGGPARFWLRARISTGGYGSLASYQPPAVRWMRLGYRWPRLPLIDTITAAVQLNNAGVMPDMAVANQLPIDLTKDFLPFGEKPRFNDTFYLAIDEALAMPNGDPDKANQITLLVTLTDTGEQRSAPSEKLALSWEFWNGKRWELLGESGPGAQAGSRYSFKDETAAFTAAGNDPRKVAFDRPPARPVEVNGVIHHWIRARIIRGNYGQEATYTPKNPNRPEEGYVLTPSTLQPPSIKSIVVDYDYTSLPDALTYTLAENDFTIEDFTPAARTTGGPLFAPYRPMADLRPTLYLGFKRPGAVTGFANRSTALYFNVAEVLYGADDTTNRAVPDQATVIWQYWNGGQWIRLGTRDETQGFTRRGLVTFIGPDDFRASIDFGLAEPLFWLRARWERGAYVQSPQLRRVQTNTTWAANVQTIQNEVLGSSTGEPDQTFRAAKAPVLPGQRIEVREQELPSADERRTIDAEEGADAITTILGPDGRPSEIWVRWHAVPDFYASEPRSRHYTLDRLTGVIRFGDGQRGRIPLQGRANVRASFYQTGGGPQGNRQAETILQLKTTVPYVDGVKNLEPATGGAAQETIDAVAYRGPRMLRHRDRAVAIADFEDLAFQASPDVALARGLPARSGVDAGAVELIVVPHGVASKPIPSLELLGRIQAYIAERLAPTVDLAVRGPDWLMVTATAEVVPVSPEAAADVQTAVLARLAGFLHPLKGGLDGKGWAFGRKPYRSDLYALIERTPGVSHVRQLTVSEQADNDSAQPDRFLVYSGVHQITMYAAPLEEASA